MENKDVFFEEIDLVSSITKESFFEFVKEFWDCVIPNPFIYNWHIEYLCNELQTVAERVFLGLPKLYDVIINISPGSSKSSICSILFPAWIWTNMPSASIIGGSYAAALSMDLSRKNRDVVECEKYKRCFSTKYNPKTKQLEDWVLLSRVQNAKTYFVTTKKGARIAVGVGGAITGMHADFIIIDDPMNPNEAVSEAELKNANRWMSETLPTRKRQKEITPTILIMQRLHQNDPTADMLERCERASKELGQVTVKHICLPAEDTGKINPPHLRNYYVDGLMDIYRLPKNVLVENKAALGEYGYAGQFLQDPAPAGGNMFKSERVVIDEPPRDFVSKMRFWDKAGTKDAGAYTAGILMGIDSSKRVWVLDVIRGRWESAQREQIIKQTAILDGRAVLVGIEQEPGSGGKESAESTVRNLLGFRVRIDRPTGDKVYRADPFSVQVNSGNVYLKKAEWNKDYLNEMRYFPHSTYKDQIDASSGAFNFIFKGKRVVGGWKKK